MDTGEQGPRNSRIPFRAGHFFRGSASVHSLECCSASPLWRSAFLTHQEQEPRGRSISGPAKVGSKSLATRDRAQGGEGVRSVPTQREESMKLRTLALAAFLAAPIVGQEATITTTNTGPAGQHSTTATTYNSRAEVRETNTVAVEIPRRGTTQASLPSEPTGGGSGTTLRTAWVCSCCDDLQEVETTIRTTSKVGEDAAMARHARRVNKWKGYHPKPPPQ